MLVRKIIFVISDYCILLVVDNDDLKNILMIFVLFFNKVKVFRYMILIMMFYFSFVIICN